MIIKCDNCGKEIKRPPSMISKNFNVCCKWCEVEYRKTKLHKTDEWLNCTCPICKTRFHRKQYAINKTKNLCCSKECSIELRKITCSGENNHQYGLKGRLNASWKSDIRITKFGYITERHLDHPFATKEGFVLQHRIIAEKYLLNDENSVSINGKRYLKEDYVVHHIDFDRQNNRVENLMVMSKEDHRKLHGKLRHRTLQKGKDGRIMKIDKNTVKVKCTTMTATIPTKATQGAAGYDLYADIQEPITIESGRCVKIPTGIAFELPPTYVGLVFARSGLSTKEGLRPANCVGVADSDYRGMIYVALYNDSDQTRTICPQQRIAQFVIMKGTDFQLERVDELSVTNRQEGGFGSTGV